MKKIILPKSKGKTTKLIEQAAEGNYYIVCETREDAHMIEGLAKQMSLSIPFPISYEEFDRKQYYGRNIKGFLFDNLDYYIQAKTHVPILTITLTE